MKKDNKENEFESIFESMRGSQRAKPNTDLFAKIEARIDAPQAKVVSRNFRVLAAAAAAMLLVMNIFVIQQFSQGMGAFTGQQVVSEVSDQSLISNYKIYE